MQEKFQKLEKKQCNNLLKLLKEEHGNLAALCRLTSLTPKTIKSAAAGMRVTPNTKKLLLQWL